MRWQPDSIDLLCFQWAAQRRKMLGIDELSPRDRLGKLNSTLGAVREEGEGASQGVSSQSFPEVYTGAALEVHRSFAFMRREWRQVIQLHYVWQEIPVKLKASKLDIATREYWNRLSFGKTYIDGFVTHRTPDAPTRVRTQKTAVSC